MSQVKVKSLIDCFVFAVVVGGS